MGVFNGCLIIDENDMNTKCWTQLYTAVSYINNVCPQFSQNISLNFQMTIFPGPWAILVQIQGLIKLSGTTIPDPISFNTIQL